MKKMLFTLSNILFLGIPYLIVRMMGGLTPEEKAVTFDKIRRHSASIRLQPFAVEGDYNGSMKLLFPDSDDRDTAEHFLVHLQRRYNARVSDRQKDVIEKLPERTFDAHTEEDGMVGVAFGPAWYNSFDHLFCHECRTPMMKNESWEGASCSNCSSRNITEFDDLREHEYVALLKVYDRGYHPPGNGRDSFAAVAEPKKMRNDF